VNFRLFSYFLANALKMRWSWSIGDVDQKAIGGVRLPGRSISENDQRQI